MTPYIIPKALLDKMTNVLVPFDQDMTLKLLHECIKIHPAQYLNNEHTLFFYCDDFEAKPLRELLQKDKKHFIIQIKSHTGIGGTWICYDEEKDIFYTGEKNRHILGNLKMKFMIDI